MRNMLNSDGVLAKVEYILYTTICKNKTMIFCFIYTSCSKML